PVPSIGSPRPPFPSGALPPLPPVVVWPSGHAKALAGPPAPPSAAFPRRAVVDGNTYGTKTPSAPGCPFPATIFALLNSMPIELLATTAMLDAPDAGPASRGVGGVRRASITMSANRAPVRPVSVSGTPCAEGASVGMLDAAPEYVQ